MVGVDLENTDRDRRVDGAEPRVDPRAFLAP